MKRHEFRLLDTGSISAAANMALDKIILEEVAAGSSPPTLRFLQFKPAAALVGYHQDAKLELRTDYCREQGIDVNRRHTGGGSIFFQESALGWEVFGVPGTAPFGGSYETILNRICRIAAEGLSNLGIDARFRPRNDIEVNGRKISGTGGVLISGGFMFQGTVLVENDVEQFVRALRVPVEKLKKREIESLLERICFLSDIVTPTPSMAVIKQAIAKGFSEGLDCTFIPGGLTADEERRLDENLPFFESDRWVDSRSRPTHESEPMRAITQTEAGTLRVHIWLAPGGKRVRQALISGDFFAVPRRLIHDLEAYLVGQPANRDALASAVSGFLENHEGRILGVEPEQVANAVAAVSDRLSLLGDGTFSLSQANELFLVNLEPAELHRHKPRWLLLPYCSKSLTCPYRHSPGCDQCGMCEIGECCDLALEYGMEPITIQSFEHLMEVLRSECQDRDGLYVGSCCEAFYAKHQQEMEEIRARGLLVNLDSTTCYDLGKGTLAYKGYFDNKTFLNMDLIEKTLRHLNESIG